MPLLLLRLLGPIGSSDGAEPTAATTAQKLGMLTVAKNGCTREHVNQFGSATSWYYNCAPTADTRRRRSTHGSPCTFTTPVLRTAQMVIAWI